MIRIFILFSILIGSVAQAEGGGGGFGLNFGIGAPFLSQIGVDYKISDTWAVSATYNNLDVEVDEASVALSMPEVLINYHPFSGSFFVAAGLGQESLEVTATESTSSLEAKIEVDAMTTIIKTGWKWGQADQGFWYGIDVAYIIPSGAEQTITAPGVSTTDPNYVDAVDAAEKFGETAYPNITVARLGYLF